MKKQVSFCVVVISIFIAGVSQASIIPKKLHFIWLGSVLPEPYAKNIRFFTQKNPDYAVNLWTDRGQRNVDLPGVSLRSLEELASQMPPVIKYIIRREMGLIPTPGTVPNYAAASDAIRLLILEKEGGVYFDVDVEPIGDQGALGTIEAPYGYLHLVPEPATGEITNGILAADPGNPIVSMILHRISDNYSHVLEELARGPITLKVPVPQGILEVDLREVEEFWRTKLAGGNQSGYDNLSLESEIRRSLTVSYSGPSVNGATCLDVCMELPLERLISLLLTSPESLINQTSMEDFLEPMGLTPHSSQEEISNAFQGRTLQVDHLRFRVGYWSDLHFPADRVGVHHREDGSWL